MERAIGACRESLGWVKIEDSEVETPRSSTTARRARTRAAEWPWAGRNRGHLGRGGNGCSSEFLPRSMQAGPILFMQTTRAVNR